MPILFEKHRIAYFDTPKVASTSIKLALHAIEHGIATEDVPGDEKERRRLYPTHRLYPTAAISVPADFERSEGYWKLAVIRDPVKRLLSAYSNRMLFRKDQYKGRLPRARAFLLGLPLEPDIDTFFLRLGRYRLQSGPLRHHTNHVMQYIGTDLSRFDAIYPIEELDRLAADLSARTGQPVTLPRLQTGGPKFTLDALSKPAFDALMAYLAPEYDLLKDYYRPPVWSGAAAGARGAAE